MSILSGYDMMDELEFYFTSIWLMSAVVMCAKDAVIAGRLAWGKYYSAAKYKQK